MCRMEAPFSTSEIETKELHIVPSSPIKWAGYVKRLFHNGVPSSLVAIYIFRIARCAFCCLSIVLGVRFWSRLVSIYGDIDLRLEARA
jgi:hypothetical protein